MSVNARLYVEVTAVCEKCGEKIEITDVSCSGTEIDLEVKPHYCPYNLGSLEEFFLKEAETSGEERIKKWLEMKKLEYELKHGIA